VIEQRDGNWPDKEDTQQLDLVEQAMKEVAERDADVDLLAKLDRLRTQVRQTLRRSSREEESGTAPRPGRKRRNGWE
jgi:hypothetical protein